MSASIIKENHLMNSSTEKGVCTIIQPSIQLSCKGLKFVNWFGYLPSGLHDRALICSSWLRRKSTSVYRTPEPLENDPKKDTAPGLTEAAFPGKEAAHIQIPPLKEHSVQGFQVKLKYNANVQQTFLWEMILSC